MNAITPIEAAPANMAIWDAVASTDPAHTKGFKRGGGFTGTAIKPMWVWQRLTEMFGPFGVGWGCDKPEYQIVPTDKEILVYCTVSAWHGERSNQLWGVGGDKAVAMFSAGPKADDEAFKKAFTDALMNAFKFIGVGADVHMGRFDDNKYVEAMEKKFQPEAVSEPVIDDGQRAVLMTLASQTATDMRKFCTYYKIAALPDLPASKYEHARLSLSKKLPADTQKEAA